jgi:RNA polymerase-binding transcription factor DksA
MTDPVAWLAARRAETAALVASLTRRLDGIIESNAYSANDDEHDPEGVTVAFERAQVAGLLAQARAELDALDAARTRLDSGIYGVCASCGGPIGEGRLEALPATEVCIRCADRR